jgi:hypothetical protein
MNNQEYMALASEQRGGQQRPPASLSAKMTRVALCLCLALLASGCAPHLATKTEDAPQAPDQKPDENPSAGAVTGPKTVPNPLLNEDYPEDAEVPFVMEQETALADGSSRIRFGSESASRRTRDMAEWVVGSKDHRDMPFAIVDKINAKVYVFGADGMLYGAAPVLLGLGIGDNVAPGIADMRMGLIPPEQRTTPAGRFEAIMGRNAHGKEILWVDYENSISMHPVVTSNPKERRLERLVSPTPQDNRISFGCINVPVEFFKNVVHSKFSGTTGIVYVLPETRRVKYSKSDIRDSATGVED